MDPIAGEPVAGWRVFEVNEASGTKDALGWLGRAYEAAKKWPPHRPIGFSHFLRSGTTEVSGGGERIVKTGHDAQHGHRINERVVKNPHVIIGIRSPQNDKEHQDDLGSRGEFAVDAGWKRPVP